MEDKQYRLKTSSKSYNTEIQILAYAGLAWWSFEQPGPGVQDVCPLLTICMATDFDVQFVNREFTNEMYDRRQKRSDDFFLKPYSIQQKSNKNLLFRENTNVLTFGCKWLKITGQRLNLCRLP